MVRQANLLIQSEPIVQISPLIYGNFMEFLEHHISGMWAQMLQNRRMADRKPECSIAEFWRPAFQNNTAHYSIEDGPFPGGLCQSIFCTEDKGGYSGLSQPGLAVKKGVTYTGYIYLKAENICDSPVEILLGKNYGVFFQPWGQSIVFHPQAEWQKFYFFIECDTDNDNAEFLIRFSGTGKLWISSPSLMPADHKLGWRKDVVKLVHNLKPNILRFPGGCYADIYHWQNAIGPIDQRSAQDNYYWSDVPLDYRISDHRTGRHKRLTEPNDVGIDEFMDLCLMTNTQALLCVNFGTGTPQEAAAWVEYCNGSADTPYGRLRAQNGHPEPYHIKYWQIGNEMDGDHEIGHLGMQGYIEGFLEFAREMKKADPSIKLLADGSSRREWNRELLRLAGTQIDYIDLHFYPEWTIDPSSHPSQEIFIILFWRLSSCEARLEELRQDIADAGYQGKIKAAICEYGITGTGWGETRAFLGTQGAALFDTGLLNLFIRNADLVEIANFSNLTNAWWASCIRTIPGAAHTTPAYHALALYSHELEGFLLNTCLDCEKIVAMEEKGAAKFTQSHSIPSIDSCAVLSPKKDEIVVAVTNRIEEVQRLEIKLAPNTVVRQTKIIALSAPRLTWINDFCAPERILPNDCLSVEGMPQEFFLSPCSLTIIRFILAP